MSRLFFIAKRFVAGESMDAAVDVVRRLNDKDIDVTLNLLGEHGHDRKQTEQAVEHYLMMLERIRELELRANISLKLSHLGQDIDEIFCLENMNRILERAQTYHNFIRLDMEGSRYTQRTLDAFYALHERYGNVGVVIQAMLFRSPHDMTMLNEAQARVRLCKGSYKEPAAIALQEMPNIRRAYLSMAEALLLYGTDPAFATHDDMLIEGVQQLAREHGITQEKVEFQMLYGLRPGRQMELRRQGYRMRVYVPFGAAWMPYFYRRLRERKENIWFVFHNLFRD